LKSANQTVLLTGATGFIGAQVTRELLAQDYTVYAIVRNRNRLPELLSENHGGKLIALQGDLLVNADLEALQHQLALAPINTVIHTVGGGPLTSNPKFSADIFNLNFKTTYNLISLLQAAGKLSSLSLFVYFSSLAAMGVPRTASSTIFYSETAACEPLLPYEQAKLQTEEFLKDVTSKHAFRTVVLRFPQIYGSNNDPLTQMIGLIRKGIFPVVRGRVGSLPLLHVSDAAKATCAVVRNHASLPERYDVNLLSEESYSYDALTDLVRKKYGTARLIKLPYSFLYLLILVLESAFRILGRPEPLNRHRLASMTRKKVVDCRKFLQTFSYQFDQNLATFVASGSVKL
jgi:nucleoside-diphosphate-sugar epimerase